MSAYCTVGASEASDDLNPAGGAVETTRDRDLGSAALRLRSLPEPAAAVLKWK
jgi:hypothetical protein